jgi:AGZA family xanthine/uracil permease-like MFS transporter
MTTPNASVGVLERLFKLSENKTNFRTEVLAGVTTFLTMCYIIIVNHLFFPKLEWIMVPCLLQPV